MSEALSREEALKVSEKWVVEHDRVFYGATQRAPVANCIADLLQRLVNVKCAEAVEKEAYWWHAYTPSTLKVCDKRLAEVQRELAEAREKAKGEQRD